MERHSIVWTQPSPFWRETTHRLTGIGPTEFGQPAILRFITDNFMDDLMDVLATDPRRLGEYRVRPETWRGFVAPPAPLKPRKTFALPLQRLGIARKNLRNGGATLPTKPPPDRTPDLPPLKLYPPSAQRYYFVTSCLVCQTPGLPDRRVERAREERVGFLVRRLLPPGKDTARPKEEWEEHAWVQSPGGNSWRKIAADKIAEAQEGEERLPMFALNFKEDDLRPRRLFAGLIPVGKREAYLGGGLSTNGAASGVTVKTARKILFRKEIAEPWKALIARAANVVNQLNERGPGDPDELAANEALQIATERDQIQGISWLVLLDFDRFLREYLPGVHARVHHATPAEPLTPAQDALFAALRSTTVGGTLSSRITPGTGISLVASSLANALEQIAQFGPALESAEVPYARPGVLSGPRPNWPNFLFPLADPELPNEAPPLVSLSSLPSTLTPDEQEELAGAADPIDKLTALVVRALPATPPASEPAVPPSAITPANALEGWFVLRCVYERPACGPLHDDVISQPTEPFQLAGFFDPDAPARPIRIGLPLDISPAGLRKFDKNTAFVMSDMLCGQLKRFKGVTLGNLVRSVLPFPLHKDLSLSGGEACVGANSNPIGTLCSLSIPIITICALILLIIIVSLLDMIFRWLPFFIVCFPIPGLKGKK
jgi:hypothetical protein